MRVCVCAHDENDALAESSHWLKIKIEMKNVLLS